MDEFKAGLGETQNYYEKQSNQIDAYLMNIIARYFDIQNMNNKIQINAIITEAISRFKADLGFENLPVTYVNNKTGIVNLNVQELGAEPMTSKRTAFNKSFGTTEDTICAGDDSRLNDEREPLQHQHYISDIEGLTDFLNEKLKEGVRLAPHYHAGGNLDVLNKLVYTGTEDKISLDDIEHSMEIMLKNFNKLKKRIDVLENLKDHYESVVKIKIAELKSLS